MPFTVEVFMPCKPPLAAHGLMSSSVAPACPARSELPAQAVLVLKKVNSTKQKIVFILCIVFFVLFDEKIVIWLLA
jgi:hypothetical protein